MLYLMRGIMFYSPGAFFKCHVSQLSWCLTGRHINCIPEIWSWFCIVVPNFRYSRPAATRKTFCSSLLRSKGFDGSRKNSASWGIFVQIFSAKCVCIWFCNIILLWTCNLFSVPAIWMLHFKCSSFCREC